MATKYVTRWWRRSPRIVSCDFRLRGSGPAGARLLSVAVLIAMSAMSPASAETPPRGSPLTLEYAIKAPGLPISQEWSGDGRRIAILVLHGPLLNARPHVYTLDPETRKLVGPLPPDGPAEHLALSSNAQLLTLSVARRLGVYSVEPFKLLARTDAPASGCIFSDSSQNAVFTADATSLWVRCARDAGREQSTTGAIALRYKLPTLELAETVTGNTTWQPKGSIRFVKHVPVLVGLTRQEPERRSPPAKWLVECLRLDDKTPCFQSFELKHKPELPPGAAFSNSLSLVAVAWNSWSETKEFLGSKVDVYATARGSRITTLSRPAHFSGAMPQDLEFLSADRYLVGGYEKFVFFEAPKREDGGLAVWDIQSGQLLETIIRGRVQGMNVSPDGRRLAVFTSQEILMYRVTP